MSMMNGNGVIDFVEKDILYCWGCPDYAGTLDRLYQLSSITEDPDIQAKCESLRQKLLTVYSETSYQPLYRNIRMQCEHGMKAKIRFAEELLHDEAG